MKEKLRSTVNCSSEETQFLIGDENTEHVWNALSCMIRDSKPLLIGTRMVARPCFYICIWNTTFPLQRGDVVAKCKGYSSDKRVRRSLILKGRRLTGSLIEHIKSMNFCRYARSTLVFAN